ncbi:MAG: LURP-one-related/scramblase family protein [Streptosporangiaceae bacterium]
MEYVVSSRWSLMERFEITDASGAPQFEARGHLGSQITLHDDSGREVADIRKHVFTDTHEVYLNGQQMAQVRHAGIFGDRYDIETGFGMLTARGSFGGGSYMVSRDGTPVASMVREFSLRETFAVDVADNENQAFLLALVLAIEAIHDERRHQGGILGGSIV